MSQENGKTEKRVTIPYFDGVNSLASFNIGKKTEFVHAENARSVTIGTIEKRGGQTVLGSNTSNRPFVTSANYGLFSFQNDGTNNQKFYRISNSENSTLSINVSDYVFTKDTPDFGVNPSFNINVYDSVFLNDNSAVSTNKNATIYYINSNNQWVPLSGAGTSISGKIFDYTYAEGNVFLVNMEDDNRYITKDGTTVVTSATGSGHLYNTPHASRINFYKNRLYLADFIQSGKRYKTTVLRSSYPMGIISLINEDITATSGGTLEVTDTKYFYTDSGANTYDIYRGQTFKATITVTAINETSIVATWSGPQSFLASDEIWISGTYSGEKVFRWVSNPSITGRDVKQYDTFKLSGGENDEITMLTNIGNVMMIANKTTMSTWNDYTLENIDTEIGCVSKKGYVKTRGSLFFIHYTGIYMTSGGIPKIISNKVEKYITGATKTGKENSAAGKKGQSIFFTLGDVTLYNQDGSLNKILPDVCLEYNLIQENWFVHKNVKATEFATFIEEVDSDRLEFTDSEGNHAVKEFLSGETDDGNEIDFRIDTMKLTLQDNFEHSSNPISVITEVERGSAMQVFVNLENGEEYYAIEGTIVKGMSLVKIKGKDDQRGAPPTCRLISISIRDSSKQICKLSRMVLTYLPLSEEVPDNE